MQSRYLSVDSGLNSYLGKASCREQSVNFPIRESTETSLVGGGKGRGERKQEVPEEPVVPTASAGSVCPSSSVSEGGSGAIQVLWLKNWGKESDE